MEDIRDIIRKKPAVMIYFYSTTCSTCQALRPKVRSMVTGSFPLMEFVEVNSEDDPTLTAEMSIFAAPTIVVFFEGKEYIRESRYASVDLLSDKISKYYTMLFN